MNLMKMIRRKEMIQKLERRAVSTDSFWEIIDKINEVIDALNRLLEKED